MEVLIKQPVLPEFIALRRRRRALEDDLKEVRSKLSRLERELVEWFAELGIKQVKTLDDETLYLLKITRLGAVSVPALVAELRSLGLEELVTYSPQRLKAWLRELEERGEEVPAGIAAQIERTEETVLGVRGLKEEDTEE